jgi:hypothetical protein
MALAGSRGAGPVGRLRRRMDAIASVELTMGGRCAAWSTPSLTKRKGAAGKRQSLEFPCASRS